MDISKKKILSPLQAKILDLFYREEFPFFLTGGTALSAFYLHHRYSQDLDFFTLDGEALQRVPSRIESFGKELRAEIESIQSEPAFKRFIVSADQERIVVDFVKDVEYQVNPEKSMFGRIKVDSFEDIASNKICAILGRMEIKDYIDLFFISEAGHDVEKFVALAKNKDAGISKATLSFVIKDFKLDKTPPYILKKFDIAGINEFYGKLSEKWAKESFPV